MKKIILALVLSTSLACYSQKVKKVESKVDKKTYLINDADFETSINLSVKDKAFKFKAGDDKLVDVVTFISMNKAQLDIISLEKLNSMLQTANDKTTYIVKNKYTYIPRKIAATFSPKDNGWMVILEYTAQNDLGATKDSKSFLVFDNKGEYLKTL